MNAAVQHSALYEGVVTHRRRGPQSHHFRYNVAMVYLDLDELPAVFAQSRWWSLERWNLVSFRRTDYHSGDTQPLKDAVLATVEQQTSQRPDGRVLMLTNLRHAGFIINPLTCYYCFDAQENLCAIVAEVTSTPWREREWYVLPATGDNGAVTANFNKAMHVSPFLPMNLRYCWHSSAPANSLSVNMTLAQEGRAVFHADLQLKRRALDAAAMRRLVWRHPLMTVEVAIGIYWQALRLWLKGNPLHPHPRKPGKAHAGAASTSISPPNRSLP